MPPAVAVSPSSISSGYAACSLINVDAQQQDQRQTLRGPFPENMDLHMGISSSSSSSSSTSSTSSSASSVESAELSDKDQLQVQSCYKGLKTQVYVCGSMANLYARGPSPDGGWQLMHTGIPAVLYDRGETRSRDKPRIQIVLAERGTCFALWRDTIDNLTSYRVSGPGFHTMCLSTDHARLIGLSFDCAGAANRLWSHVDRLTSDPENIRLSGPGNRSKHARRLQKQNRPAAARRLPDKSHISQPCCFEHVTNVGASDRSRYVSLQNLVAAAPRPGERPAAAAAAAAADP